METQTIANEESNDEDVKKTEALIDKTEKARQKLFIGEVIIGIGSALCLIFILFATIIVPIYSVNLFYYCILVLVVFCRIGAAVVSELRTQYLPAELAATIKREKISYNQYLMRNILSDNIDKTAKSKFQQKILGIFYSEKPNEKTPVIIISIIQKVFEILTFSLACRLFFDFGAYLFCDAVFPLSVALPVFIVAVICFIFEVAITVLGRKRDNHFDAWLFQKKKELTEQKTDETSDS